MTATEHDRRRMLGIAPPRRPRPPWTDDAAVASLCTACGACIAACPEGILGPDERARPLLDPQRGTCTFCGRCAEACTHGVFDAARPAQPLRPLVSRTCLEARGIVCEICRDACEAGAIRILRRAGATAFPRVDEERCTGCGGCVAPCPVAAITLGHPDHARAG